MFILTMSCLRRPYLVSNSSSKMASSKLFEHSSPIVKMNGFDDLPTLRCHITGGLDVWHPMPTSASRDRPRLRASKTAIVLAEYVYRLPAPFSTSSGVVATPGIAFQSPFSPSRYDVSAPSM